MLRFLARDAIAIVPTEDSALPARLRAAVTDRRDVLRLLPDPTLTVGAPADPKGAIDALLTTAAQVVDEQPTPAGEMARFRLDRPLAVLDRSGNALLGDVRLEGWTVGRRSDLVVVSLLWRAAGPVAGPRKASTRRAAPSGETIASS